jgi:hypothetical protein
MHLHRTISAQRDTAVITYAAIQPNAVGVLRELTPLCAYLMQERKPMLCWKGSVLVENGSLNWGAMVAMTMCGPANPA